MEHLNKVLTEHPELIDELFNKHVCITLKVDGMAFQIVYNEETNEIEYHKRSGGSTKIGPIIDDYSKLLVSRYAKAIKDFDKHKDLLDDYKFLAVEIFDEKYVLLTAVTKNDEIIDDSNKISKIATKLGIDSVPVLLNGKLTETQKDGLKNMMTLSPETTTEEYKNYLTNLFSEKEYTEFLKGSGEIEGIVLSFDVANKIAQYKIINPAFKTRHDAELQKQKEEQEKFSNTIEQLLNLYIDKLKDCGEKLNDKRILSLEANFLNLMKDAKFANKVMNITVKLQCETNPILKLNIDECSNEMKKFLKRMGPCMVTAYKQFVMAFYKVRKKNYIISKEFQDRINEIIEKI